MTPEFVAIDSVAQLKEAKHVIEERAKAQFEVGQAEYEAKLAARETKAKETVNKGCGNKPGSPAEGPRPKDHYNFTDPESAIR